MYLLLFQAFTINNYEQQHFVSFSLYVVICGILSQTFLQLKQDAGKCPVNINLTLHFQQNIYKTEVYTIYSN
jgi:hypothetical protein